MTLDRLWAGWRSRYVSELAGRDDACFLCAIAALDAGCDLVLQCSGKLNEMRDTVSGCRPLEGLSLVRARAAERFAHAAPEPLDRDEAWARLRELLALNQGAVA